MDFDEGGDYGFGAPALVYLTPFASTVTPTPRRPSSCFTRPNKPPVRAKRQLSWLSFQGRLVGAEEATAAKTIDVNGVLGAEEAVAWDLFTPIQRVLVVAVVAAAAANSKKNKRISQLQKSVELRVCNFLLVLDHPNAFFLLLRLLMWIHCIYQISVV